MCDYSLHAVASRPARVGDKLMTTRFANTLTRGFAAINDPCVAVCVVPGTEIAFDENVTCEHFLAFFGNWWPSKRLLGTVARFRQINQGCQTVHHDALEFPNGQIVLLTGLLEGQHATVLQLPAFPHALKEAAEPAQASAAADSFIT
ncbi:MAG: hypothetical protein ACXU9C_02660 [Xanthobacteraceae bacterium]